MVRLRDFEIQSRLSHMINSHRLRIPLCFFELINDSNQQASWPKWSQRMTDRESYIDSYKPKKLNNIKVYYSEIRITAESIFERQQPNTANYMPFKLNSNLADNLKRYSSSFFGVGYRMTFLVVLP